MSQEEFNDLNQETMLLRKRNDSRAIFSTV
jgi:hypothetical protein